LGQGKTHRLGGKVWAFLALRGRDFPNIEKGGVLTKGLKGGRSGESRGKGPQEGRDIEGGNA